MRELLGSTEAALWEQRCVAKLPSYNKQRTDTDSAPHSSASSSSGTVAAMTVAQLRTECARRGMTGVSRLRKSQLLALVRKQHDTNQSRPMDKVQSKARRKRANGETKTSAIADSAVDKGMDVAVDKTNEHNVRRSKRHKR